MTKDEVLKLALVALEVSRNTLNASRNWLQHRHDVTHDLAITAIREALAEPEQEPNKNGSPCPEFWDWLPKAYNFEGDGNFTKYNMEVAFLAGKQASQPEQEPMAMKFKIYKPTVPDPTRQDINNALLPWVYDQDRSSGFDASMWVTPVSTLPPQRKPLSDEQTIILKSTTCPEIDWKARHGVEMNNGERNKWMLDWFMAFKVAIEAAHGIKENT